jgi:hypothetical protein
MNQGMELVCPTLATMVMTLQATIINKEIPRI